MFDQAKPYPAYKDSGHPWLGEVPEHWEVLPNRAIFREVKDQGHVDEPMLSVTIARGVIPQKELLSDTSKKDSSNADRSKYKLVQPGDIAYNKMRAWQGAFGHSSHRGIVSPAYIVQQLMDEHVPVLFHHMFRTPTFAKEAERWSYGITSDMWSLRPEHFKAIHVPVPPPAEQAGIVRVLEAVDRRVNRMVKAKRRLLGLLAEQKQAVITHAVTRGLDPHAPTKPSGVPWLGDVPKHWEVVPLKRVATVQTGLTLGKDYEDRPTERFPYLRVANVQAGHLDLKHVKDVLVPRDVAERCMLRSGDVLMTEGGDIDKLGRGCIWHDEVDKCLHQNHVFAVRCKDQLRPAFLSCLLASAHGRGYFELSAKKTTNLASTNSTTLGAFPVFLPTPGEQKQILQQLDESLKATEATAGLARREIDLIREYRTRLVADVVTGKLDVRAIAKALPPPPENDADDAEPINAGLGEGEGAGELEAVLADGADEDMGED